jgi:hypothetical protein
VTDFAERFFPKLADEGYAITSETSTRYNCVAWAVGEDHRWWEPDPMSVYYWPSGVEREDTLDSYVQAFRAVGFQECADSSREAGFEKVAIYVDETGLAVHAARQLPSGRWTSKMTYFEDIEHATPESLTGDVYTRVAIVMRRASH